MIDYLIRLDKQLLLFINGAHTIWLDQIMFQISKIKVFIPLFLIWIYFVVKLVNWKGFLLVLAGLILMITLADQSANLSKNNIKRPRPTHNTSIGAKVHTVNEYRGGDYGFYSGHATNTFGIALFLFMLFRNQKTWVKYSFFPFAIVTSYSRMYLGVHYPFDIFIGMIIGLVYGYLAFKLVQFYLQKWLSIFV
jgi:undecaprenyl-diphosphatase